MEVWIVVQLVITDLLMHMALCMHDWKGKLSFCALYARLLYLCADFYYLWFNPPNIALNSHNH